MGLVFVNVSPGGGGEGGFGGGMVALQERGLRPAAVGLRTACPCSTIPWCVESSDPDDDILKYALRLHDATTLP